MMKKRVIADPYLRDRVVLSEGAKNLKKWALGFSILAALSIIGVGIVYFPGFVRNITGNSENVNVENDSRTVKPVQEKVADKNVPSPTKPVENSAQTQTADRPSSTAISQSATPVPATDVQQTSQSLAETAPSSTESDSKQPDKSEDSSTASTANSDKSTEIEKLVAKAKEQIARSALTTPAGNNAYETYQTLSTIAPDQANSVLNEIVTGYIQRGKTLIEKNELIQPSQRNAYEILKKLQTIAPQHADSKAFSESLLNALEKQGNQYIENGQLTQPAGNNAQKICQAMYAIAPDHQKTQTLSTALLNPLFAKAEAQMTKNNLTTPKDDSALNTYREILVLFPDNAQAKEGIKKIAREYYTLALKKEKQGKYYDSLLMAERGLEVTPDDAELSALKSKVEDRLKKKGR